MYDVSSNEDQISLYKKRVMDTLNSHISNSGPCGVSTIYIEHESLFHK